MYGRKSIKSIRIGLMMWNVSYTYFIFYNLYIKEYSEMMFFVLTMIMTIKAYINFGREK